MMLRKTDASDNVLLRAWRNANAQYFPPGEKITASMQEDWYRRYVETPHDHQYMACLGPPGFRPVGTLAIDIRSKVIGRVMRGRPEGKGVMGAAVVELMMLYGAGLYELQVLEGNQHAIAFYERLGFRKFGRQLHDLRDPASPMMVNMLTEYNL
jgi:RimJ/RimL family protein N-acetyltransferase